MDTENNLHIENGENFTKNQLKLRLKEMGYDYDSTVQRKDYFVDIYNKAVKNPVYKNKIEKYLLKDTNEYLEKKKKRIRDFSHEPEKDLKVEGKSGKVEILNNNETESRKQNPNAKSNLREPDASRNPQKEKLNKILEETGVTQNINYEELIPKKLETTNPNDQNIPKLVKLIDTPIFKDKLQELPSAKNVNIKTTKISINKLTQNKNIDQNSHQTTISSIESQMMVPTINKRKEIGIVSNILQPNFQSEVQEKKIITSEYVSILNKFNDVPVSKSNFINPKFHSSKQTVCAFNIYGNNTFQNMNSCTNSNFLSQINIPKIESNSRDIEIKKDRINISNLNCLDSTFENGQMSYKHNNMTINKIGIQPIEKSELGYKKWYDYSQHPSLRLLIKYCVAGAVCAVVFCALYYCIKNSNIIFEIQRKEFIETEQYPKSHPSQITIETKTIREENLGLNYAYDTFENEDVQKSSFSNFLDKIIFKPLSNIFWAINNPRDFLLTIFIDVLHIAGTNVWTYFKEKILYFGGFLILAFIASKGYTTYKVKRDARNIFSKIKEKLKVIYDSNNFLEGIPEDEIIREYSKDYGYKEEYFKNNILPQLRQLRNIDGHIREFETYINGRNRIAWQYVVF